MTYARIDAEEKAESANDAEDEAEYARLMQQDCSSPRRGLRLAQAKEGSTPVTTEVENYDLRG